MKIQDVLAMLVVAAATAAFTLGMAAPQRVDAVDQPGATAAGITPRIGQPTLELAGLKISLALDKPNYAPGDKPVITLEAGNPTDRRVETKVWIGITSSSFASMMSRAPTMPSYLWSDSVPLALEPGETKELEIATGAEMVAGTTVSVTMSNADQRAVLAKLLNLNAGSGFAVPQQQGQ